MKEDLLFWIKLCLEVGVLGTIISILSIILFKKNKLIKYCFATTILLLFLVIIGGILLLNPLPQSIFTSTKASKIAKVDAPKNIKLEKAKVKQEVEQVPKAQKLEPKPSTKKDSSKQISNISSTLTEVQAQALVVAKIKSFEGKIEGPIKIVEEGFNQYYSFNVYEPSTDRYVSVFVNTKTGELTNSAFGINTKWD